MNGCCFPNHVLYPSSYLECFYFSADHKPPVYAWAYGVNELKRRIVAARSKALKERIRLRICELRSQRVTGELDKCLAFRQISFKAQHHPVHSMTRGMLLHQARVYNSLFGGDFFETGTWGVIPIADFSDEQLRKLVLLCYDEFGGVRGEQR